MGFTSQVNNPYLSRGCTLLNILLAHKHIIYVAMRIRALAHSTWNTTLKYSHASEIGS